MSNALFDSQQLKLFTLPQAHSCSYLPDKQANSVFLDPRTTPSQNQYSSLTRMGFRRSGQHFYRPNCPSCQACISCRVLCQEFKPNKRQQRILKRNRDIELSRQPVQHSSEYFNLYQNYIAKRHPEGDMYPATYEQYESFILSATSDSFFIEHRINSQLIAVALTDALEDGWSAIYTFFDPEYGSRSLGIWSLLNQIQQVADSHLPYLYLGYWIKQCSKMSYKADYQPQELYDGHQWRPFSTMNPE